MDQLLEAIQTKDGKRSQRGRGYGGGRSSRRNAQGRRGTDSSRGKSSSVIEEQDALPVAFMISKSTAQKAQGDVPPMLGRSSDRGEEELDLYTWCEECGINNIGECFIHGKIIAITDNKLPSRARLSLPSILTLKKVQTGDEEKQGVFAKKHIKPRTQFGPLEAPVVPQGMEIPPDVFDVRIITEGHQERLDLTREEACNWMMFVRPATVVSEVNLAAYQLNNQIYYISTKAINQMTELRVWYITSYGRHFGKEPLPYVIPEEPLISEPTEEKEVAADLPNKTVPEIDSSGPRVSAGLPSEKLVCGLCNTPFRNLSQLVVHTCHALEELESSDSSSRPARRKGLPRKVSSSRRGRARSLATSQTNKVQTETNIASADTVPCATEQAPPAPPSSRKRGRPKGSKSKLRDDIDEQKIFQRQAVETEKKRKKPRLDCQYCERSFYSEEQHRVHEADHTGTKPYICEHSGCGKGFGSKFKYWRHSLVHQQPQNRQCPYCPRSFNRVDHLKNHVMTHDSNRKLWSCEKCGKQYLYRSTYMFHMAQHKAKESNNLSCYICSHSFPTREALVQHVKTHNRYKPDPNKEKAHQCPECDKLFTTSKDVRRHLVTHTKVRSFLCEFCPQTFARKDHLRRHYKSNHKKEVLEAAAANVDFPCVVCLAVFKTEEHLQYHMSSAHPPDSVQGHLKKEKTEKHILQQQQEHFQHPVVQVKDQSGNVVVVTGPKMHMPTVGTLPPIQQQIEQQQQVSLLTQQNQQQQQPQPQPQPQPIQIHINQHHQQQLRQQNVSLQPASFIASLTGTQAVEVVGEGDTFNQQSMTLKTIPCRFSPQLITPLNTNTPSSSSITPTSLPQNLRQILSSYTQQQQQVQPQETHHQVTQQQSQTVSQHQPFSQTEAVAAPATPTIVSMLSVPRQDNLMDGKTAVSHLTDQNGQLKTLSTQWVLSGNSPTLPEVSIPQSITDVGDHCYATGTAGLVSSAGDMGLKLPSLSTLPGKVVGPVTQISDLETLRLLQNCYAGGLGMGVGSGQSISTQPSTTSGTSNLQASWDTISDLVTIPLAEMMPPLSSTQASVINLPVTVNVPATDGSSSATTSHSQHA